MKKLNKAGFSLVELIIVIAIMAVLIGVLSPIYAGQTKKAKKGVDIQNAQEIATSIAIKAASGDDLDPTTGFEAIVFGTDTDIATAPAIKLDSDYEWYYSLDANGNVKVGVTDDDGTTVVELYPSVEGAWATE